MTDWGNIIPSKPASEFDFDTFSFNQKKTKDSVSSQSGGCVAEFDFSSIDNEIAAYINENAEVIAKQVAEDAKAAINDVTGNLKKGIKARKSRFEDGGWIVLSTAPHAGIVEYGHGGQSPAPPHPYLRPALDKNIDAARAKFGAK